MPQGESWELEPEENWGTLTLTQGPEVACKRIPSFGDWRDFYANVRDAMLGLAPLEVTSQQMLDVMRALEIARESSSRRHTVLWPAVAAR